MDSTAVPLIFSPRAPLIRVSLLGRLLALAVSLGALSLLVTAALLVPSPTGLGTHTALGLLPCGFQQRFGIPCPSCGMTTSWAWFARGDLPASLWVQPMGAILAIVAAITFWSGLYVAVTGRAAHLLLRYLPSGYIIVAFLALTILAWIWKINIQHYRLDGWK